MAEPTLGQRILDAADDWQRAYGHSDAGYGTMELDFLRALAARADAAERLAVATDDFHASCLDIVITRIVPRERDEEAEFKQALAAWRAITEEVQP